MSSQKLFLLKKILIVSHLIFLLFSLPLNAESSHTKSYKLKVRRSPIHTQMISKLLGIKITDSFLGFLKKIKDSYDHPVIYKVTYDHLTSFLKSLSSANPYDTDLEKISDKLNDICFNTNLFTIENKPLSETLKHSLVEYLNSLNETQAQKFFTTLINKIFNFMDSICESSLFLENYLSTHDINIENLFQIYRNITLVYQRDAIFVDSLPELPPSLEVLPYKISYVNVLDLQPLIWLFQSEIYDANHLKKIAKKINDLILKTDILHPKKRKFLDVFMFHFKKFTQSLSLQDQLSEDLIRFLAKEILNTIPLSLNLSGFLKQEILSPKLDYDGYFEIYKFIIKSYPSNLKPSHQYDSKLYGSFIQPRVLSHITFTDLIPLIWMMKSKNTDDFYSLAKMINHLFLKTDLLLPINENLFQKFVAIPWNNYSEYLSHDPDKELEFKNLLLDEMILNIDLSEEFHLFLEEIRIHPNLKFTSFLPIYKNLMLSFHSKSRIRGYLEGSEFTGSFIEERTLYHFQNKDYSTLLWKLKAQSQDSSSIEIIVSILNKLMIHSDLLLDKNQTAWEELYLEIINYFESLPRELKLQFISSLMKEMSESLDINHNLNLFFKKLTNSSEPYLNLDLYLETYKNMMEVIHSHSKVIVD